VISVARLERLERDARALAARAAPDAVAAPGDDPEADAARADPDAWAELYSCQKQAAYHRTLQGAFSSSKYLIIEGPPEVGKSQQITLRRVLWEIGRRPNIAIGIVGAKAEQAYEWIRAIRVGLESEVFRRVFPGVRPGFPWSTERLYVQRDDPTLTAPTCQGIGIGGSFLGARLDLIVLDDVLNAINTATREQRRKVLEWIDSSMCAGRLLAGGRLVLLGNTWTSDDAIHELSKRAAADGERVYTYRRDPLPDPDEPGAVSPLPEIWPIERLRERRDLIGPSRYRWQYQLQPRGAEDSRFDPAWFERTSPHRWAAPDARRPLTVPVGDRVVVGVDLGIGLQERHDRTAIVVLRVGRDQVRHVLYAETLRATGPDIISRLAILEAAYLHADGSPMLIRVETVAAQEFLAQFARARLRSPIASHNTSSSSTSVTGKAWGIEQVAIRAETGQLLFCLDARGSWPAPATALRDGLLWYTPKEHTADDVMALLLAEVQAGAVGGRAGGAAFGARAAPTEGGAGMREGA
jgi:hypothetical protein